ncbi:hypothetical protein KP509_08G006900 [Ceratopteris richardii]|uniref:Uncharacterized protein n=1 Tax=Ceratopteris richardii TaxID=49495 RepID=A0A8T2UAK7_CERRI|nr:hypothetical protein KP509_08G006900 [Ceratopteris richardii]
MPSLRWLDLVGCSQLEGLDSSLGKLTDLRILILNECRFPSEIAGLPCMQELYLEECTSLTALSCLSTSLQILSLFGSCNVERLNLNVWLPNLHTLNLSGCTKLKVSPEALVTSAPSLRVLDLREWGSLKSLDCEGLSSVEHLILNGCSCLTTLSFLPTTLRTLTLEMDEEEPGSLETVEDASLPNLQDLSITRCPKLRRLALHSTSLHVEESGLALHST